MTTMTESKHITRTKDLGYAKVFYSSEFYQGQICDTAIRIGQQHIITISGCDIENFHKDLVQVIEKYRI